MVGKVLVLALADPISKGCSGRPIPACVSEPGTATYPKLHLVIIRAEPVGLAAAGLIFGETYAKLDNHRQ